ncbi:RNA polymerase sigma factor [Sphingobacterium paludis]|uniref:RNA polymerase sigma factor n=1 Tax=Sphingobacterium paludis TaxID=1476465 RepID=A0A4R7CXB0_9SPHI|nr:sigma-70 family RNA polymerase sigma factor [Sphingobacterium paludis]TDS11734.1 RNA polymerase sigma-70 factor (ECF subfamily) [Sphingobacterium paludis]
MTSKDLTSAIQQNAPILKSIALKFTKDPEEIQELVQETLALSLKFYEKYFNNPRLVAWLYVIMKNVYINGYRRHQKRVRYENFQVSGFKEDGCMEPSTENLADKSFLEKDVKTLLSKYPGEYYALFLSYTEGYKYRELSEIYSLPEGTVKTRIHHMRKYLQKQLAVYRQTA